MKDYGRTLNDYECYNTFVLNSLLSNLFSGSSANTRGPEGPYSKAHQNHQIKNPLNEVLKYRRPITGFLISHRTLKISKLTRRATLKILLQIKKKGSNGFRVKILCSSEIKKKKKKEGKALATQSSSNFTEINFSFLQLISS